MSLVTIISRSKNKVDWSELIQQLSGLPTSLVEYFPIPKELGFREDALGLSVAKNDFRLEVFQEIKLIVTFLNSKGFQSTELYTGILVTDDSLKNILTKLGLKFDK